MLTLVAGVFRIIVLAFFMSLEIVKIRSNILALVARVFYTFVFGFLMCLQ